MKISVAWVGQLKQIVTNDLGNQVPLDGPVELGGQNTGMRPMQLLLAGLGGCANIEVVQILKKMRLDVKSCQVDVQGKRHDQAPHVFTNIHLTFKVAGTDLKPKNAEKAINLTLDKYCSAASMLSKTATISFECVIETT